MMAPRTAKPIGHGRDFGDVHNFTRANDFISLPALLRTFCDSFSKGKLSGWLQSNARVRHRVRASAISSCPLDAAKACENEAEIAHGKTSGFAPDRKPLKSLATKSDGFVELCVFNDLTAFSFRAVRHCALPTRNARV
jgi:hypothetical protein